MICLDEFNNAAYCFYKAEKNEEDVKENAFVYKRKGDIIKIGDTVEVEVSENPFMPNQTLNNTRGLFRNYLDNYSETAEDTQVRKNLNTNAYDKWKTYAESEEKKTETGYYAPKQYSRLRRLAYKTVRQPSHDSIPVSANINIPTLTSNKMSTGHIRMEEGANSQRYSNPSLSRLKSKRKDSVGFNGLIMPVLEPFFPDPNAYKRIKLTLGRNTGASSKTSLHTTSRHWRSQKAIETHTNRSAN